MARAKFQTLTEQMFYILLCFRKEACGMDVADSVNELTNGRVKIGPGTLYNLTAQFVDEGIIEETRREGRRCYYVITADGEDILRREYDRLKTQINDYEKMV